jgi:hypothetical protein
MTAPKHKHTSTANAIAQHLQKIKMAAEKAMQDEGKKDIRELLDHASGSQRMVLLEPAEVYDKCIVAVTHVDGEDVLVYNKLAVIIAMTRHMEIDLQAAVDVFTASLAARRLAPAVDAYGKPLPKPPIFIVPLEDYLS